MSYDIIGFAAINEDRIRYVDYGVKEGETFSRETPRKLKDNQKSFLGGSVVNTLAGLAKFGFSVAALGKLGKDEAGNRIDKRLKEDGIDFLGGKDKEYNSSVAEVEVGTRGQRRITVYPGVNDHIEWKDVESCLDLVKNSRLFHSSTFACAYSNSSLETQIRLAGAAKKRSLGFGMLYCDLFDRETTLIESLLEATDILIINKEETERLGKTNYMEAAGDLIKKYGIQTIAVTLGKQGSHVFSRDEEHFVESRPVKVVDTTGAGDAYSAGFLAGYLKGKDLRTCGIWGNRNAEKRIEAIGATNYQIPAELKKFDSCNVI